VYVDILRAATFSTPCHRPGRRPTWASSPRAGDRRTGVVRSLVASGIAVSLGLGRDVRRGAARCRRRPATSVQSHAADSSRAGLAGAVLADADVAAGLICDGRHVHPAAARRDRRGSQRASSSRTAPRDRPAGGRARAPPRPSDRSRRVARPANGTTAGIATMGRAFPCSSVMPASMSCGAHAPTTPAADGPHQLQHLRTGAAADLTVMSTRSQARGPTPHRRRTDLGPPVPS
jgi:hypothetical protein